MTNPGRRQSPTMPTRMKIHQAGQANSPGSLTVADGTENISVFRRVRAQIRRGPPFLLRLTLTEELYKAGSLFGQSCAWKSAHDDCTGECAPCGWKGGRSRHSFGDRIILILTIIHLLGLAREGWLASQDNGAQGHRSVVLCLETNSLLSAIERC
jgi:hypothetical protein